MMLPTKTKLFFHNIFVFFFFISEPEQMSVGANVKALLLMSALTVWTKTFNFAITLKAILSSPKPFSVDLEICGL